MAGRQPHAPGIGERKAAKPLSDVVQGNKPMPVTIRDNSLHLTLGNLAKRGPFVRA